MEEDDIKIEELKKADINEVSTIFKDEILLNENRIDELKELAEKNNFIKKESLRPIAWKIFLGLIPEENHKSLEEWIDIIDSQRNEYKNKLEKYCSFLLKKNKTEDPLLINENKDSDDLMKNNDDKNIINLINLDLIRTHQNIDLFRNNKAKNVLFNVLYVYSKESTDLPYGQGMNELVSFLYICLYPYYFTKEDKQKKTKDEIKEYLNDIDTHYEDIYLYFHDEEEIQSDLFFLFESIMYKAVKDLYAKDEVKKDDKTKNTQQSDKKKKSEEEKSQPKSTKKSYKRENPPEDDISNNGQMENKAQIKQSQQTPNNTENSILFRDIVDVLLKVETCKGENSKDAVKELLSNLFVNIINNYSADLPKIYYFLSSKVGPEYISPEFGIGEGILEKIVGKVIGISDKILKEKLIISNLIKSDTFSNDNKKDPTIHRYEIKRILDVDIDPTANNASEVKISILNGTSIEDVVKFTFKFINQKEAQIFKYFIEK